MPVYDLLGGRVRPAARVYRHASGSTVDETLAEARSLMEAGFTHIRLQTGQPGLGTYGAPGSPGSYPGHPNPDGWDVGHYLRTTPELFARARAELGDEVELLHDVHSRLTPKQAVVLARALEPYRLYFLEDPIAPEHYDRLPEVRAASPVPLAVGELVASLPDAVRLVRDLGVDLIRLHISAIGGLTPARKVAALCELLGVGTAWHAPGDVSPVGAAANLALDVSSPAFDIQEAYVYSDRAHEVFPGTPVAVAGYATPSDQPGWGVDLDERRASQYPPEKFLFDRWATRVRRPYGSLSAP
jgi:mannonate dehydratase